MSRINLTDGSGRWFNNSTAVKFKEDTKWNGNNNISVATGSQWDHQALYYTKGGNWVLWSWSQWQGSIDTYVEVTEDEAINWLSANSCWGDDGMDQLPQQVRDRVQEGIDSKEL